MELPAVVRWIRYPKKEDLAHGYSGFALLSCELDPYSKFYKADMEDQAEQATSEKYGTFTVSLSNYLHNEDDAPQGKSHIFIGDFVKDAKWGWQFKADFYYQDIPSTEETLRPFLMEFPNVKEERSLAIIKKFGVEGTIEILDKEPYRLTEISGITEKRIPPIIKAWEEKKGLRCIYHWFVSKKLTVGLAKAAFKLWGKDTIKLLEENPYRLVEIHGVGFVSADQEAHKITENIPDEFRTKACMHFILKEVMRNGNLCLPYSLLKEQVLATIKKCDENLGKKTDLDAYLSLIPSVLRNNLDFFTAVKDSEDGADHTYIYLKSIWEREQFIANSIYARKDFAVQNYEEIETKIEYFLSQF